MDINYISVLNYLNENAEIPYSNPESSGIAPEEKQRLLQLKEKGQSATAEMKKMTDLFSEKFKLDKSDQIKWIDGSKTRFRVSLEIRNDGVDKKTIQKSIDILNENFVSDKVFKNFIIYKGQMLKADVAYVDIYQQAAKSIYDVDDYMNTKT